MVKRNMTTLRNVAQAVFPNHGNTGRTIIWLDPSFGFGDIVDVADDEAADMLDGFVPEAWMIRAADGITPAWFATREAAEAAEALNRC